MKKAALLILPLIFLLNLYAQDSLLAVKNARQLIASKKYASAHRALETAIQERGFQPEIACLMVENALLHYFKKKGNSIFYLSDVAETSKKNPSGTTVSRNIVSLRYPQHILAKVIREYPRYGKAYKLLGDYYVNQTSPACDSNLVDFDAYKEIETLIFDNYEHAFRLGVDDPAVNRWLGDYYKSLNQYDLALKYYLKNVENDSQDPLTYLHLSEIYFALKKYSQSYDYASMALQHFSPDAIAMRYKALRLAGQCLLNLGEMKRFLDNVLDAIQLLPDQQGAYLDLLAYYDTADDWDQMKKIIEQMLLNNPYDSDGFEALEKYAVKFNDFLFSENLFEKLIMKYENYDQIMGNIYWFRGNLLYRQGMLSEARKFWEISRSYFRKYLPEDSPFLKQIGNVNKKSSLR